MKAVRRRDKDGIDIRRRDQLFGVGKDFGAAAPCRYLFGTRRVDIHDCSHIRRRHRVRQIDCVSATHSARADYPNVDRVAHLSFRPVVDRGLNRRLPAGVFHIQHSVGSEFDG
jgi:hypothetical protein